MPLLFQSTELSPSSIKQEITLVYGFFRQMKVKRGIALESFSKILEMSKREKKAKKCSN